MLQYSKHPHIRTHDFFWLIQFLFIRCLVKNQADDVLHMFLNLVSDTRIEDITWLRRDTKFLFECWKIFHEWAQRTSEIFSTREEKFRICKRPCNCSIYYININEIPNHFTETVLSCKRCNLLCSHSNGDIFTCENNMLFSHVKISCFRAKAHLVFHWCL